MKLFIFLSELLEKKVLDRYGKVAGRLHDLPLRIGEEVYPRASGLIIHRGLLPREFAFIPMTDVVETEGTFKLKIDAKQIPFQKSFPQQELTLRRDILDQQVVDTFNQKVVRVNDIHLLRVDQQLYLAHVDVGLRGLVRRLDWTPAVDFFVKTFNPQSNYLTREDFISWKNTQLLTLGRYKNVLRLGVAREKLSQIPSVELAEIMEDLDIYERRALFKSLDEASQRKLFAELATQEKQDLVEHMEDKEAATLLANIPADEATDLLVTLPKAKIGRLLRFMETKQSKKLGKLLGFEKNSAGGLMTTEYLFLSQNAFVRDALQLIKDNANQPVNVYHLYVVDDQHRLVGATSARQLLVASPEAPIIETIHPRKIFVRTDDSMEEVALLLEKYKFTSLPVLNDEGILQGAITIDDVMEELISLAWRKYKTKLT